MTIVDHDPTSQRAPWAKQRILETADKLFYDEGIKLVGVDLLISVAHVTKATFYKHYRSKDNLVIAYIANRHATEVEHLEQLIAASRTPATAINSIVDGIVEQLQGPGFRGCAFLNAASEYPDATNPVRILVEEHREWYGQQIESLLAKLGHGLPGEGADDFILARDGAMAGGYAGDAIAAAGALQRAARRIVALNAA